MLNGDENEGLNEDSISNSWEVYYEKQKITLKDFVPRESIPSLCSAARSRNATEGTSFMSETMFKDVKDKNKRIKCQT